MVTKAPSVSFVEWNSERTSSVAGEMMVDASGLVGVSYAGLIER